MIYLVLIFLAIFLYRFYYFHSEKFQSIKQSVENLTTDFNELNEYADALSLNILGGQTKQLFVGGTLNSSKWGYKHSGLFSRQNHRQIYHCSRSIVSNAQLNGFKYLTKYFEIGIDDEHRDLANKMLSNFVSFYESRNLLIEKRGNLYRSIENDLPLIIKYFKNSLYKQLGLGELDLNSVVYPEYIFSYTSAGGNSGIEYYLQLNINNLELFITWLDDKINYRKSIKYQRVIMNKELRTSIKIRDNYTCKVCGVSVVNEPTLLLEVDHIIPISKGGLSVEDNLQCLCWKCNRTKGAK